MKKNPVEVKTMVRKEQNNQKNTNMADYLIIGNSASGLAAARSIREEDKKGRILVLTEEKYKNYSKPLITYYLAGKVSLDNINFKHENFYSDNDIELLTETRVEAIDPDNSEVVTGSGEKIQYKKLLIAAGGKPVIPRMMAGTRPGKESPDNSFMDSSNYKSVEGVFTLTTLEDSIKIKNYIEKNKINSATILGGGLIGLKSAEAFLEIGININIIELADRVLSATFDSEASSIIENAIQSKGSRIYKNNTIDKIFIDNKKISGYRLRDGKENECRLLIMAIGVSPDLSFINKDILKAGRGIIVDERMRTTVENIYASGDIIEGKDMLLEENRNIAIWPLAVRQGDIAGKNMAGRETIYDGGFFMNSVEILGIPSISMGITNPVAGDSIEIIKEFRPDQDLYKKIAIKDNKVIGIIMIGNIERAGIYCGLIRNRIDLSGVRANIFREDFGIIHLPADYKKHLVVGEGIEV